MSAAVTADRGRCVAVAIERRTRGTAARRARDGAGAGDTRSTI